MTNYAVGSVKFKTKAGLLRALIREGAHEAEWNDDHTLVVTWEAGAVTYTADAEGKFEQQLEFDFYLDRRKA